MKSYQIDKCYAEVVDGFLIIGHPCNGYYHEDVTVTIDDNQQLTFEGTTRTRKMWWTINGEPKFYSEEEVEKYFSHYEEKPVMVFRNPFMGKKHWQFDYDQDKTFFLLKKKEHVTFSTNNWKIEDGLI